ncbi:MAG: hypothetical protein J6M39_07895 [Lachnospiraceae bacterium]|nr:hypothetical protein [Lachnospiraceae bacterium]
MVTCLGYALENIYKIPNLNLSYNAQFNGQPGIYWYAPGTGFSKAVDRHGGNALADGVVLQTGSTQIKLLEVDGKTKDYDAKHIYQTNQKNSIAVGKKTISKNTYDTLLEGMPVLAALDKDTVKWQSKFKTYNNGIETDYNVKVKLVVGTFAELDTITTGTVVCKNDGQTEDYLVTSGAHAHIISK